MKKISWCLFFYKGDFMENINENNKELENVQQEPEVLSELDMNLKIPNSKFLAQYLGNNTLESDTSTLIDRTPTDLKSYLSLYARGQLKRIEKLTEYLDKMEDKLLNDMERYEDKEFLKAIQLIQQSLSNSVELVKMIGTAKASKTFQITPSVRFVPTPFFFTASIKPSSHKLRREPGSWLLLYPGFRFPSLKVEP